MCLFSVGSSCYTGITTFSGKKMLSTNIKQLKISSETIGSVGGRLIGADVKNMKITNSIHNFINSGTLPYPKVPL